jgi:transposase
VAGLYLDPPDKAVVLCVDEKSQVQALERTAPVLPLRPGIPEKRTHDYIRHGTTTLFAALEAATGQVTGACYPRHRHQEFLAFLRQVAKACPRRQLHIVTDNYGTRNHQAVRDWLAKNPRVTLHFTPTSASWLNMVDYAESAVMPSGSAAAGCLAAGEEAADGSMRHNAVRGFRGRRGAGRAACSVPG